MRTRKRITFPSNLHRSRMAKDIPHYDADEWIEYREYLVRLYGDKDTTWAILWTQEGMLQPWVRRELAARGERI